MNTTPLNVLLIEDNPRDARLMQEKLCLAEHRTNIQLEWVDRLAKGLEHLNLKTTHAVLVNLSLPDSEGLNTLQCILSCAPQLPVIVFTGQADEEIGLKAMQAGAQDYLIKGQVDGPLLQRVIQYAVQRKQIEMQLADSLEFTEHILTSSPIGIFTYRLTGECLSANASAAQMVGTTIEQLKSQNFHELESWRRSGLYALAEKAIATKTLVADDVHVITTFGRDAWYRAQFVTFHSGAEELLLMIFGDITERKFTEKALLEREALLDQTQAISHVGSWQLDLDANLLTWSEEVYRIFGIRKQGFGASNQAFLDIVHPDDRSAVDNTYLHSLRTGSNYEMEHRIIRRESGEIRFVHEKCEHIRDASGQIVRSIGMVQDITERKQAEEALKASEQRYRDLTENFPNGVVCVFNKDLILVFDAGLELKESGYRAEEFIGKHFTELAPQDTWEIAQLHLQAAFEGKVSSYQAAGLDGQYYTMNVAPLYDINGNINEILVVSQNITNLKKAQLALQEKQLLLSETQHIGRIGSLSYSIPEDRFQFSDEMYSLLDISVEKFQHTRKDFLALIYPSDRLLAAKWIEDIRLGKPVQELEFRIFRKNGELRYLQCKGAVEFNADGRQIRFIGTLQDTTERRMAEIQINQQLKRLSALSEIDRAIISGSGQQHVLDVILSQTISQLQVDAADILILDSAKQELTFSAGQGFHTKRLPLVKDPNESQASKVLKERRLVRVANLNEHVHDPLYNLWVKQEEFVSYIALPLIVKREVKGVLEVFHRSPFEPYQEWLDFLNTLAGQAVIAIEHTALLANLQATNQELIQAYDATIVGWSHAMDLRDREAEGHTQRVTSLTGQMAHAMGVPEFQLSHIRRGALLHDIGKLGVPDDILFKPGSRTSEEWVIMQKHPEYAYDMLSSIQYLKPALAIPYFHHEKWDGSGYPVGLQGEQIPLEARIFAVIDVWDALTSDRPFRAAWKKEEALAYIREQSGKHFDPQVVEVFFKVIESNYISS